MKASSLLALLAWTALSSTVIALPEYSQEKDGSGIQAGDIEPTIILDDFINFTSTAGVPEIPATYTPESGDGDGNTSGEIMPPTYPDENPTDNATKVDIPLETATVKYDNPYPVDTDATSAGFDLISTSIGYGYQPSPPATVEDTGIVVGAPVDVQYSYGEEPIPSAVTSVVSITTTQVPDATPCVQTVGGSTTTVTRTIPAENPSVVTQIATVTNDGGQVVSAETTTVRVTVTSTRSLTDTLIMCRPVETTTTDVVTETDIVTLTSTNVEQTTETVPVEVTATVIQDVIETVTVQENFTVTLAVTSQVVLQETVTSTSTEQVNVTSTDFATALATVFVTTTSTGTETAVETVTITDKVTRTVFASVTVVSTVTEEPTQDTREPIPTSKPCTKTVVPTPSSY